MLSALHRLLQAMVLLAIVSALVFALIHAVPGGPLAMYLENPNVRPEDIERLRHSLGLDRPLIEQYLSWLVGFVRGDWGFSYTDGRPVAVRLIERIPATIELIGVSLLVALLASVPIAVWTAVRRGAWIDRLTNGVTLAAISLPAFWFALVLQLLFAVWLGWLPSSGRTSVLDRGMTDRMGHLMLPATVLAALHGAAWARYLRSSMGVALRQRFVLMARAKGIAERAVIYKHALRTALLPFVTVVMLDAAIVVSGAVVTESVFAWPGLGGLFYEALLRRDYTVLMAFLMLTSTAVIVLNASADLLYRALDPRVRVTA
ncbi:MAG: ABC transporter permease [Gemmatimonadaceae bacterium]